MIASNINLGSVHFFVSSVTVVHDSFLWIEEALWMCCHVIKRLAWGQFICIREQITKEKWMELRETLLAFRHKYFVYILGCTIFFSSWIFFCKEFIWHICIYFFTGNQVWFKELTQSSFYCVCNEWKVAWNSLK